MSFVLLSILSGVFLGISISLLLFNVATAKELKRTKQRAMFRFYNEVLEKKEDKTYQYSQEVRGIINASHLAKIFK